MRRSSGKTAFCFPGQLQERPRLDENPLLTADLQFKECLSRVSGRTKFDLLRFSVEKEREDPDLSLSLQISTYLLSMIYFHRARAAGWAPDIFAEHSMGIYAALAAAEAVTFEEGLFITESIGKLLEREGRLHRGGMASIIGLPLEEVEKICRDLEGYQLVIANYNGSMQYVLSGEEEGIKNAISLALSRKAVSARELPFKTALHSPALSSLREEIMDLLRDVEVRSPKVPIINHWTVRPLGKEEIKDFLSQEIGRPVYWIRCVERLLQEGITRFVEIGHETTLTKLIRWVNRDVEAFSAGNGSYGKG